MRKIILDLAGVVVDMNWDLDNIKKSLNQEISVDTLNKLYQGQQYENFMIGQADEESVIKYFLETNQLNFTIKQIQNLVRNKPQFVFGMRDLLEKIYEKYHLCCVSNEGREWINYKFEKLYLKKYFKELYFSCDFHCLKPSEEFFEKLTKRINLTENEVVLIDDNLNICRHAILEGIPSICFINAYQLEQELIKLDYDI